MNRSCTAWLPYSPGGRLMECTTIRSTQACAGRGPKLGDAMWRAPPCLPCTQGAWPAGSGVCAGMRVVVGCGDVQARNAVADLPQADPQPGRRGGAVEVGGLQGAHQNVALLLVQPGLQV